MVGQDVVLNGLTYRTPTLSQVQKPTRGGIAETAHAEDLADSSVKAGSGLQGKQQ